MRPSVVLANSVASLIVLSSFLHRLVRSLLSALSSSHDAANRDSLAARDSASLSSASVWVLDGGGSASLTVFLRMKVRWRFWDQFCEVWSAAGLLAVCKFGMSPWLQKAQIEVSIGKYMVARVRSSSSVSSGVASCIVLMKSWSISHGSGFSSCMRLLVNRGGRGEWLLCVLVLLLFHPTVVF